MTLGGVLFLLVVAGLIIAIVTGYNKLVGLRQRSEEAWSDIDVQLKRRTDLVPNLVETVRGYAAHEKTTLDQVIRARGAPVSPPPPRPARPRVARWGRRPPPPPRAPPPPPPPRPPGGRRGPRLRDPELRR